MVFPLTGRFARMILGVVLCFLSTTAGAGTVVDQGGRTIVVDKPFSRIISLYGAHTENLSFLGLDREIIGVARSDSHDKRFSSKPWFSYHDDPEKFLGARPDLVLVRPMIERGYPGLIRRLERSGITVASLQPATVEEMYDYWLSLGSLTGQDGRAAGMVADFQRQVAFYRSLTQGVTPKKRVYFEAIHSRMKTFTPGSVALFALEAAGGINVAGDAVSSRGTNIGNYGKERILSHGKEIDVFLAQQGVMNQVTLGMIKNEPGFGIIKAVRNDQVYLIDEMIVSRPGFRLLQGIRTIGEILYPELFGALAE
ncbi:MAG: ABC transporter substrate-binding protein [Desulfobacteraceae bacterium]|nr:ABC transporter substrate-binding protein [Desulfobacteraceae bacterium]